MAVLRWCGAWLQVNQVPLTSERRPDDEEEDEAKNSEVDGIHPLHPPGSGGTPREVHSLMIRRHSARRAIIGSTREARRAGMKQETMATAPMTSAVPRRVAR
jgi:hypothetical protein